MIMMMMKGIFTNSDGNGSCFHHNVLFALFAPGRLILGWLMRVRKFPCCRISRVVSSS